MASALPLHTGTTNPKDRDLPNRQRSVLGELEQLQHRFFPSPPGRFPLPESPAELTDQSNPKPLQSVDPIEVNDDMHLMLAFESYKAGDYKRALEHSNAVYERDMYRTNNLVLIGAIYFQMRAYDKCIEKSEEALAIDPLFVESYGNMGNAFREKGELDRAIQCYLHAIEIRPSFWDAWLNLSSSYMLKGKFAESAQCCRQALALNPCSADAHFNLGALMKAQGLTQQAFHSYMEAVSIRPNFAAAWSNLAGLFVEAGDLKQALVSYQEAVKHKPDFSDAYFHMGNVYKGARNEVFAMQPAPIQVSYMGFPGTTGADYIQYLVTDEFVSPLRFSHIYSEKLVHLPHCYFVNDYKQRNKDALDPVCLPKRSDYGLPEDKFIFACFNQLYKLDPDIFRTWCNILKRVPKSALWLLRFPAAGETRLRSYAAAQGVSPDQIFFTGIAENREHVRRCALADLFLDTPLCNAHTTGTDVLWAGMPMITLPMEKMATRVAGSLCLATGVGEDMIVNSMKEYEEKAVSLARDPSKLQQLRTRLEAARLSCPLFDTSRWVHNMERAFFRQWSLYCSGQQPQHFKVIEDDNEFPYDR